MASLPNVRVSQHPSLQAKLSQLRSRSAENKEVKSLIHDIALIVACEALSKNITAVDGPKVSGCYSEPMSLTSRKERFTKHSRIGRNTTGV